MRHFLLSLSAIFLLAYISPAQPVKVTTNDLLKRLLDLPAPPPGQPVIDAESLDDERPDDFYSEKNIPPDDAPLNDLLAYWKDNRYAPSQVLYRRPMSSKSAERLLDHFLETDHAKVYEYLGAFPTDDRTAASIRKIYSSLQTTPLSFQAPPLREWLTNNTSDGIEALTKHARKIRDRSDYVSNEHQVALRSLARLDWDAARPHVERLEFDGSNPHSQILAYWVRYSRAIGAGDSSDIETYRRKLQQIVEDQTARWSQRDLAMDALVDGGQWNGRDDWYVSLFADETLLEIQDNGYTGMTTMMNAAASTEEWKERFLKMVRSDNKAIRSAAARNLVNIYNGEKEIIEALLPWVTDPNWAKESQRPERGKIIAELGEHDLPGAVQALIAVLSGKEEDHWLPAATALAKKKDLLAAPVLRSRLQDTSGELRSAIIVALIASGAMSADEQMTDVEAYAVMSATEAGRAALERASYGEYADEEEEEDGPQASGKKKPGIPIEVVIGQVLADSEEPDEGLAVRAIERVKVLRKRNPEVATRLAEIINGWKGTPIYLELLRQMRSGEGDLDSLLILLIERESIRSKLPAEVASLRSSSGITRGVGACIAETPDEFLSIVGSGDAESQISMLGCARLLRIKLPVDEIARLLAASNNLLKLAADRYLESEDSPEARKLLLAKHSGQARILGSFSAFVPEPKNSENNSVELSALFQTIGVRTSIMAAANVRRIESELQSEIRENKNLIAIFARLPEAVTGQQVIRVYNDRITFALYEDTARFWSRELSEKEYKDFYNFVQTRKIDALPPSLDPCEEGGACPSGEFLMLGRDGGRRTFFSGSQPKGELAALDAQFEALKAKDLKLTYRLSAKIKGLEVLVAEPKMPVHAVWKNENDLRFLVSDLALLESIKSDLVEKAKADLEAAGEVDGEDEQEETKQRVARYQLEAKRRVEASGKELSWRTLENGKVGPIVGQPEQINLLPNLGNLPDVYRSMFLRSSFPRTSSAEVLVSDRYSGGLFRVEGSGDPVRIREGNYSQPIVSPDKKWAAVTKSTDDEKSSIVRVNIQTGQEFAVGIPSGGSLYPIAFLPSHNRVLIYRGPIKRVEFESVTYGERDAEETTPEAASAGNSKTAGAVAEYYLLDLHTGAIKAVKGDFRPIEDPHYRPLQASATPGATWAAVYDPAAKTTDVGLYVEKTFSFVPVATLPEIRLGSSDIWVHEKENKIYFVYQGHLLAAPLKQQ